MKYQHRYPEVEQTQQMKNLLSQHGMSRVSEMLWRATGADFVPCVCSSPSANAQQRLSKCPWCGGQRLMTRATADALQLLSKRHDESLAISDQRDRLLVVLRDLLRAGGRLSQDDCVAADGLVRAIEASRGAT
jgi:hypothetical protein